MRRSIGLSLLFCALMSTMSLSAQVVDRSQDPTLNRGEGLTVDRSELLSKRNSKQDKNSRQQDVYMLAVSYSLVDSMIYISSVQRVSDVTVNNRYFLVDRAKYEAQYSKFLGSDENDTYIPVVYFSEKEKKMVSKKENILKRNDKKVHFKVKRTPEFIFSKIEHQTQD